LNYRNKRLTHEIPSTLDTCLGCGGIYPGGIVAAHSNQLRDGKGKSIKAHDYRIAYLCATCHYEVDQGQKSYEEKIAIWEEAHRKTIGYLFESGHITVK
jgi:hypothetical protein